MPHLDLRPGLAVPSPAARHAIVHCGEAESSRPTFHFILQLGEDDHGGATRRRAPRAMNLSPGCRAVELSRLRRAAVEAVVEALPVEPCRACRVAVEVLSSLSRLTACA